MSATRHGAPIVLAAGGTGGHVFPAQALAVALESRGWRLVLVTDRRGADYGDVLGRLETHHIRAGSPRARGLLARGAGVLNLLRGVRDARRLLKRLKPAAAIGFGGYPSVPTMYAASRLRLPTAIHEQNAVLGRANRLLAPRVLAIATSFVDTARLERANASQLIHTGNPVRPAIAALAAVPYAAPPADGPCRLLITGGSQGAGVFAEVVPAALARLPEALKARLVVTQQCRAEDLEAVRRAYDAAGVEATLARFFADLPERLATAHLVIGRAGASTVAELAAAGRPAILVPYPHATDDHQSANAEALALAGGAWVVPQDGFTAAPLAERLAALCAAPDSLARAADAALGAGRPEAASTLADLVERLVPANGDRSPSPNELMMRGRQAA